MSRKEETLSSVLDSEEKSSQWATIIIALVVGLITLGTESVVICFDSHYRTKRINNFLCLF